jgi:uncharacterized protein (DUF1697 family)
VRYVALLRGINVGGKNVVTMADLRTSVTSAGFADVSTYIQSGNVLFSHSGRREKDIGTDLEEAIENAIESTFGRRITAVVRSQRQLTALVHEAPHGFGQDAAYLADAIFLKHPLTASAAMEALELHGDVDRAWPGDGVVYFDRVAARRTQSKMSRIVGTDAYRLMTIRNWRTTTTLLARVTLPA